jgi:hypothetical protein
MVSRSNFVCFNAASQRCAHRLVSQNILVPCAAMLNPCQIRADLTSSRRHFPPYRFDPSVSPSCNIMEVVSSLWPVRNALLLLPIAVSVSNLCVISKANPNSNMARSHLFNLEWGMPAFSRGCGSFALTFDDSWYVVLFLRLSPFSDRLRSPWMPIASSK